MNRIPIRRFFVAAALAAFAFPLSSQPPLTEEQRLGQDVFQACIHCHNVLTDARRGAPSLRTLFGKVRLRNGKRTLEDNVAQFILDGKDGMPSYRYMFRPELFNALMAYLKTLRARPEIRPLLAPIRGADREVLTAGRSLYLEHCASCHDGADPAVPGLLRIYSRELLSNGEPVAEASIVPRIREGHAGMPAKKDSLDDAALFRLIAFLKAQPWSP
jgi:mono/diheme cytochrome c family protein